MGKASAGDNITLIRARLTSEAEPEKRALLHRLLIAEEDKLTADLALLDDIDLEIANGRRRIERQQALVAAMQRDGRDATMATALLNGLGATLLLYQNYRGRVLIRIEQNPHDRSYRGASSSLDGLSVLIVEDSWQVGATFKRALEAWGANVAGPAATVADAARLISERTIDVALVDINLRGGEQSYGLIDQLRDRGIRVIVVSACADVTLVQGKVAMVLQKPVQPDALLKSLHISRT